VQFEEAAAGHGPTWAGNSIRDCQTGTRLMVRAELPPGVGAGNGAAIERAIRLCLGTAADGDNGAEHAVGHALLDGRRLPCDLAAAGLRLMLIDTRVRRAPGPVYAEESPVSAAATALETDDFAVLGALLTAAHAAQPGDPEQQAAVTTAIRAGALGARAITEGQGRPALVLIAADRVPGLRAAVCADLERAGYRVPRFLTFTPTAGASQLTVLALQDSKRGVWERPALAARPGHRRPCMGSVWTKAVNQVSYSPVPIQGPQKWLE
jgi:galactokinase